MQSDDFNSAFVNTVPISIAPKTGELGDLRLAVKDLFDIAGIPTSAGNPHWLDSHPVPIQTNACVQKLLESGAQYVGKTVTDELAYSLVGQNIHYTKLRNPITPDRIPGGSSSGSAVAVAAGLADIGLGTDTGGSIRVPASYNGLFGLRTTHGLIENDNMVALAPSFDTIGWMTRSIEELLKVTSCLLLGNSQNLTLDQTNTKVMIFDSLVQSAEQHDQTLTLFETSNHLPLVYDNFNIKSSNISETFRTLQGFEIWQQHGEWIKTYEPVFAKDIQQRLMWCKSITKTQYELALKTQSAFRITINKLLDECDTIVIPTTPGRAPYVNASEESLSTYREHLMGYTAIAGLCGLPQLHLPIFNMEGAPCGLSFIGKKNSDLSLVMYAKKWLETLELTKAT